jgi:hypothetical protein
MTEKHLNELLREQSLQDFFKLVAHESELRKVADECAKKCTYNYRTRTSMSCVGSHGAGQAEKKIASLRDLKTREFLKVRHCSSHRVAVFTAYVWAVHGPDAMD